MGWHCLWSSATSSLLFIYQIIYEYGETRWNNSGRGKLKNLEKNLSHCHFSTTCPTCTGQGANPDLCGKRSAANQLPEPRHGLSRDLSTFAFHQDNDYEWITGKFFVLAHRALNNSIEKSIFRKLIFDQLVKNFHPFYRTRRFITVFTKAHHRFLSWARATNQHPLPLFHFHFIFYLCLGLPSCLFPSGAFPIRIMHGAV
jgi:hypothetical protein